MHDPVGVTVMHDAAAVLFGRAQALQIEAAVDRLDARRQHPQRDLRRGAVMRGAEGTAAPVRHLHRFARLGAVAVRDVAGENPRVAGGDALGRLPVDPHFVHRMACRRAIRSSVEGCVENSRIRLLPVNGLMMNRCAVAGEASIGIRFDQVSSFCNPLMSGYGEPMYLADAASAEYSREREIAIWISMAAIGAKIIMRMPPNMPPRSSSSPRGPNQNAMRASMVIAAAIIAATE